MDQPIDKKLVVVEQQRPVAVQIAYADWLEIEQRLNELSQTQKNTPEVSSAQLRELADKASAASTLIVDVMARSAATKPSRQDAANAETASLRSQ